MTLFDDFKAFLDTYDYKAAELQSEIDARDSQINSLNALLQSAQNSVTALQADVAARDQKIAALNAQITALNAQVADLQKQLAAYTVTRPTGAGFVPIESITTGSTLTAKVSSIPAGSQVTFPAGEFNFSGFDANGYGFFPWTNVAGVRCSGIGKTIFAMLNNTSTSAAKVPAQSAGGTNPLYLMRVGGSSSAPRAVYLDNFTLEGTPQGHLYNGLQLYWATGSTVDRVQIKAIAGDNSANPGETFSIGTYHGNDLLFKNLDIDGRDASGAVVGSTAIGLNFNNNVTVQDSILHDRKLGAAISAYTCTGNLTYTRVTCVNNAFYAFNFEQNSKGTVTLDHCVFRNTGNSEVCIDSSLGSMKLNIIDPDFDGPKFRIKVHSTYNGATQLQQKSDITLTVNGVSRPDLIQWLS